MKADLKPGDIFCVASGSFLARCIRFVEWIQSRDGKAVYNHAGIILNPAGTTFEALWTLKKSHISEYTGKQIFIVRPASKPGLYKDLPISEAEKILAYEELMKEHEGQPYPFHRLFLMIFRPLAKIAIKGAPKVCSEITQKYESKIEIIDYFTGVNPDDLADRWHISRHHRIVFEGEW